MIPVPLLMALNQKTKHCLFVHKIMGLTKAQEKAFGIRFALLRSASQANICIFSRSY